MVKNYFTIQKKLIPNTYIEGLVFGQKLFHETDHVSFHLDWHSILSDIPFWVTFHIKWHSILSDIQFWVTFHFERHFNLSDEIWGIWGIWGTVQSVCQWVSQCRSSELETLAHLQIPYRKFMKGHCIILTGGRQDLVSKSSSEPFIFNLKIEPISDGIPHI